MNFNPRRDYLQRKFPNASPEYIDLQLAALDQAARDYAAAAGKVCNRCGERKPLTEYSPDDSKADGLRPTCKVCRRN